MRALLETVLLGPNDRHSRMLLALALLVTAAGLAFNFWIGDHQDWFNYSNAVARVVAGNALYGREQVAGAYDFPSTVKVGYSYPPPSILFFFPFASNPWGLLAYTALSVAAFLTGIAAIVRSELGSLAARPLAAVLLAANVFPGYIETLRYGNVNLFIAGTFAWTWAIARESSAERRDSLRGAHDRDTRREIYQGVALGAATTLKLFPSFFAAWLVRRSTIKPALWAATFVAAVVLLSVVVPGVRAWSDYLVALRNVEPACDHALSLPCLIVPVVGVDAAKTGAIAVATALALLALAVRSKLLGFALLAVAVIASVMEVWSHYLLFPFVVAVVLFSRFAASRREAHATNK